ANRWELLKRIDYKIKMFKRFKRPFALIFSDIDKFKVFNDRYGHDCGDYVLVSIAEILRSVLRESDSISRWGGEEFVILLPENGLEQGRLVAEKIREKVASEKYYYKERELSITMTFGVSVFDGTCSIDDCFKKADDAMYLGKQQGRNRVVVAEV
ncbi:MAG: GGDEF domain-containing protein, partial [bacterium]|nr:GGDEF domain-containing protein [bacterium]